MEFLNCRVVLNPIGDEVSDNVSNIVSECSLELPDCSVVLNRMTDEEINYYCAPGSNSESARKVKTGLKTRKRTRCGEARKIMRPRKQVATKTRNANKHKKRSFSRKISGSSSDFTLDWSLDDETIFEKESIKIKLKRRRKFKKVCQANGSSVHNARENVVNVHPSYLNNDANSILQSPNLSSKCDLDHQEKTSTFDSSANYLRDEQNNNAGQVCDIVSNSKQLYSYSDVEDIPLSTLKNMSELELKNILSLLNSEVQSSVKKKAKPLCRKRNKRLRISPQNEKSGSGNENCVQLTNNAIEIQELEGSVKNNEVDLTNSPLSTTPKESEDIFLFDHNSGSLHKSANANWNNGTSLKSPKEKNFSSRCHSWIDNLLPINCNSDEGLKSNESGEIKREKKTESKVKIFKKCRIRKYCRKKEHKAFLLVKELDGKSDQLTRKRGKEKNSYNEVIRNNASKTFVKTNESNEKLNHPNSKKSKDEAIITSSKQNQSEQFPKCLILKQMVGGYQTVQAVDKAISHDTRKDIKLNQIKVAYMQKGHYSCRLPKDVKTDRISVTESNLNNPSPPIEMSLNLDKSKLMLNRKLLNPDYSYKPDHNDVILRLCKRNNLLVGNQSKNEQFKGSFKENTADKRSELTNFTDSQENCHFQDKCQSLKALARLKTDEISELSNIKETPESTDTKDDYLSLCNSPTIMSPVQSNYLYIKENLQDKISPFKSLSMLRSPPQWYKKPSFKSLSMLRSPPQSDNKRDYNKIVPCVKNVIKVSTDNSTEIPHQNANRILPSENNLSPVCGLINPSIPYTISERHSTNIPTCSKKARLSDSTSFDFINTENSEIKISDVCSLKYLENRDPHQIELHGTAPVRIDSNINDLNNNASETNVPTEKISCLLSSIKKIPTSEIHLTKVAEPYPNDSLKHTCKAFENVLSSAEILDVITFLAIADLEENPQSHLKAKISIGEALLKELSQKRVTLKLKDRIQKDLYLLNIAEQYLIFHGSFSNVSDYFLKDFKRCDPVRK